MTKIKDMSSEIVIFGILDGHIWDHVLDCLSCWGSLISRKWQTRHGFCEATFSFWGAELSCLMSFWGPPSRMKIEDMSSKNVMLDFGCSCLGLFIGSQMTN